MNLDYARIPDSVLRELNSLRSKNPLAKVGSENTNAVFVEIGKNLIVDFILQQVEFAKRGSAPEVAESAATGGDFLSKPEIEQKDK